jgi:hypothetical protein
LYLTAFAQLTCATDITQAKLISPAGKEETAGHVTVLIPDISEIFSQVSEKSVSPSELQSAISFDAYVVLPGQQYSDGLKIKSVFPWIYGNKCLLHIRGFPQSVSGTAGIVILTKTGTFTREYRLDQVLTLPSLWTDVVFLLDDSYSMRKNDPQNMRALAVKMFAEIAGVQTSVSSVSIIAFARDARLLLPPVSPRDNTAITQALESLKSRGSTDMDLAFSLANKVLARTSGTRKIVILVSDGRDEPGYYMSKHLLLSAIKVPVFTIGLSQDADVETLKMISEDTNGAFFFAPTADTLATIFKEIAFSLHRMVKIDEFLLNDKIQFEFPVDDTITLLCIAGREITGSSTSLLTPSKERIVFEPSAQDGFHKIHFPPSGLWRVISEENKGVLSINGLSNIELIPYPVHESVTAGKPFAVASVLVHENEPLTGAQLSVRIKYADGIQEALLYDDGKHGDNRPFDGIYAGTITAPSVPGTFSCEFIATGITSKGFAFRRKAEYPISVIPELFHIASVKPDSITIELEPGEKRIIEQIVVCGKGEITVASSSKPGEHVFIRSALSQYTLIEGKETKIALEVQTAPECEEGDHKAQIEIVLDKEFRTIPVTITVRRKSAPPLSVVATEPEQPSPEEVAMEEEHVTSLTEEQIVTQEMGGVEEQAEKEPELKKEPVPSDRRVRHTSPAFRIALWLVLLALLLALFVRWLLMHRQRMPAMTKYMLISIAVHALAFLLTMNIAIEVTRTPVERISPAFALSIRAVENMLGFEITPPATEIPINESATIPHVPRKEIQQSPAENKPEQPAVTPLSGEISTRIPGDILTPAPVTMETLIEKKMEQKELQETVHIDIKRREQKTEKEISRQIDIKREYVTREEKPQVMKLPEPVTVRQSFPDNLHQPDIQPALIRQAMSLKKTPEKVMDIEEKPSVSTIEGVNKRTDEISHFKPEIAKAEIKEKTPSPSTARLFETKPEFTEMSKPATRIVREMEMTKSALEKISDSQDKYEFETDVTPPLKVVEKTAAVDAGVVPISTKVSLPVYDREPERKAVVSPCIYAIARDVNLQTSYQPDLPGLRYCSSAVPRSAIIVEVPDENIIPTNPVTSRVSEKLSGLYEYPLSQVSVERQSQLPEKTPERIPSFAKPSISGMASELKSEEGSLKPEMISSAERTRQSNFSAEPVISDVACAQPRVETKQSFEQFTSVFISPQVGNTGREEVRSHELSLIVTKSSSQHTALPQVSSSKLLAEPAWTEKSETKQFTLPEMISAENIQIHHRFVQDDLQSYEKHTSTKLPDISAMEAQATETRSTPQLPPLKHSAGHLSISYGAGKVSPSMIYSSTSEKTSTISSDSIIHDSAEITGKHADISGIQPDTKTSVQVAKTLDIKSGETMIKPPITRPGIDVPLTPLANVTAEIQTAPLDTRSAGADFSFMTGTSRTGQVCFNFGLAKYSGDWYCSGSAMMFLAHQLANRTGLIIDCSERTIPLSDPDIMKLPFIYLTGHKDFVLSEAEVLNLRKYLENGGYLWADDSTHYGDETFDRAFRREIARVLPSRKLEKLDKTFPAFRTGYDLTEGFKGYAIPPGDKYRVDYIEGIRIGDRVAVVYTRNDYGDGLCIDPYTHPLKVSLTDLSPLEMQESSLRMAINLVLYFISGGGKCTTPTLQKVSSTLKSWTSTNEVIPSGEIQPLHAFNTSEEWNPEQWGDSCSISIADKKMNVQFEVGNKEKVAISKNFLPHLSLSNNTILAMDVESHLHSVVKVALGLTIQGKYYETTPFYIKPGSNTAFFRMSATTFKTADSNWEYKSALKLPASVERLTILVYSPFAGRVMFHNLRIITVK